MLQYWTIHLSVCGRDIRTLLAQMCSDIEVLAGTVVSYIPVYVATAMSYLCPGEVLVASHCGRAASRTP